ncbi:MAG: DUF5979 domain-containing protein [Gemmatimonadota bacterium]
MIEHARDGRRESRPFRIPAVATMAVALFFGMMTAAPAGAQAPAHTGSLSVKKVLINNTGGPITPPPTFATTTHCSQNAATLPVHTPVAVPGNTTVAQPGQINTGLICSVTEVVPPPIKDLAACKGRDATWTAAYSPPVTIVTGQGVLLTVTNTLNCNPPTGGTLQIHKTVVNTLNVPTPPSFNMTASCSGMSPVPVVVAVNGTVTVPPAGQIAGGTVCTISETLPPQVLGVKACPSGTASWVASNPGPLTVQIAQTTGTIITNTLTCDKPPATGSLAVRKVVVNNTGGPAPIPPTFATTTHCSANAATLGVNTPVAVPGSTTVTQPGQLAAGIVCSVTETLPPPIPSLEACKGRGATWTASYSPPVTIVAGQTAVLTVTNTLTCNPPTGGTLQIHKSVVNTLNVPTPPSFNMVATCTGMSPVPVTVAVNGTVTVPPAGQIAGGTVCTISETLPPQVLNVKACPSGTASWVASNPGPLTVQIAQTTGTIITNTLTCDKPPAGGHLTVYKVVVNSTGGAAPIPPTFNVTAHCTLGGAQTLHVTLPVPANGGVSAVPAIPFGSNCSITEGPLPSIANLPACKGATASWTTSYSAPVTIAAGPAATLTATNTLRCDPSSNTGSLKVIKSVANSTGGPVPMPSAFAMTVNCTPSGPSNQAISVAPGPAGTTINGIAAPSQCVVTEAPLATIAHAEGCKGGSASWTTVISPAQPASISANGTTTVTVRNMLVCDKPVSTACLKYMPNNTACRIALMINRTKGPITYTVTVSPAAITPSLNTAPSSASTCVNAGGTTVYQTTCAFFYNSYPTAVTLTATSSSGTLPPGFGWSGACSGSSATCVLSVVQSPLSVVANFP